jgi:hypothetical protein
MRTTESSPTAGDAGQQVRWICVPETRALRIQTAATFVQLQVANGIGGGSMALANSTRLVRITSRLDRAAGSTPPERLAVYNAQPNLTQSKPHPKRQQHRHNTN